MDKIPIPHGHPRRISHVPFLIKLLALSSLASLSLFSYWVSYFPGWRRGSPVPRHAAEIQDRCRALNTKPGPPPGFHYRTVSDRFVEGTKSVWIKNATIWTGRVEGLEVIHGDVLLMNGIIKMVGHVDLRSVGIGSHDEVEVFDAHGAYVTPGYVRSLHTRHPFRAKVFRVYRIIDVHSHMGVGSSPALEGALDVNSMHGPIVSWLRSIDGLNTHDAAFELAAAGGVTTSLILPGSANAIGTCLQDPSQIFAEQVRRW